MDKTGALQAIEELRAKGWSFSLHADQDGWNCEVVGSGLANGRYGGCPLEEAVERAITSARAMEDDPAVILARHGAAIRDAAMKAFGLGVKYRLEVHENNWEWGPKRIHFIIQLDHGDVQKHVDQEGVFYRLLMEIPREVFAAILLEAEWPSEKADS